MAKRAGSYLQRFVSASSNSFRQNITSLREEMGALVEELGLSEKMLSRMVKKAARAERRDAQRKVYAKERYWRKHDSAPEPELNFP